MLLRTKSEVQWPRTDKALGYLAILKSKPDKKITQKITKFISYFIQLIQEKETVISTTNKRF